MLRRGHLTFSVIARCAPAAAASAAPADAIPFSQRIAKYAVDAQDMRWLSRAAHHAERIVHYGAEAAQIETARAGAGRPVRGAQAEP